MQNKKVGLVSVIIPMYNAQAFIKDTLLSVINQTYTLYEIIIIDDCSTDESVNIVEEISKTNSSIRLIKLDKNFGGPARPRNIGIEQAKGEYIAFLDADDIWHEEKLEKQVDILKSNENIFLVSTQANGIDAVGNFLGRYERHKLVDLIQKFLSDKISILFTNIININTTLVRNENLPIFNEERKFIAVEDWIYWIELLNKRNMNLHTLEVPLIDYRIRQDSISRINKMSSYKKNFTVSKMLYEKKRVSVLLYVLLQFYNSLKYIKAYFKKN